jgi:hypothetical protein
VGGYEGKDERGRERGSGYGRGGQKGETGAGGVVYVKRGGRDEEDHDHDVRGDTDDEINNEIDVRGRGRYERDSCYEINDNTYDDRGGVDNERGSIYMYVYVHACLCFFVCISIYLHYV